MKMTMSLPNELLWRIKIQAAATERNLNYTVEELVRHGLNAVESGPRHDALHSLKDRLRFNLDGAVTNLDGIDDPGFFQALDESRVRSRREVSCDFVDPAQQ